MFTRAAPDASNLTLGPWLGWLALFAFNLVALLALERWYWAAHDIQVAGEALFLVRLACATALPLTLVWNGAGWLARRFPGHAHRVGLALSAAVAVGFWFLALPVAQGDGVQDLPIEPWWIVLCVALIGFALTFITWSLERLARARWAVPLQCLLACALSAFAIGFGRIHGGVASAALLLATLNITSASARLTVGGSRLGYGLANATAATISFGLLWALLDSARLDVGRRTILMDQRIPLGLHGLLFGADERVLKSVRLTVADLTPADCARLPKRVPPPALTSDPSRRRNVLLISIDALRRDALGAKSNGKRVAPNLFAWSQQAQLFQRATTSYAATFFSVTGALTGLPASRIALLPTPPRTLFSMVEPTIARRFIVMPARGTYFRRPAFIAYALQDAEVASIRGAPAQTDVLLQFIAQAREANEPFLAWVHFAEAHAPYKGHPEFNFGEGERELYFSEIAFVDAQFGRVIDGLKRDGSLEDTMIIVFADHGESLGQRAHHGHHVFLNRWIADVPLILHVPSGEQVPTAAFAQTSDIAPTVLHFLGLQAPYEMASQSLLDPQLKPHRALFAEAFSTGTSLLEFASEPVVSEAELVRRVDLVQSGFGRYAPSVSVTEGNERLIVNRSTGLTALYDTQHDPEEERDLSLERPERLNALLGKLDAWHREQSLTVYCAMLERKQGKIGRP